MIKKIRKNIKDYILYTLIFFITVCLLVFLWKYYIYPSPPIIIVPTNSTNEDKLIYVSSRGILKSCNVIPRNIVSSIKECNIDYSKIKDGSVVYVTGSAIQDFANNLKTIQSKFVLVSGDCDESIPDMVFKTDEDFNKFIGSDKIIHWFSQNAIKEHPKLTKIPIGLDYHSKGGDPLEQENLLIQIKEAAPDLKERKIKCYSNFHFNKSLGSKFTYDRNDAIKKINTDLVFYEPVPVPRNITWKNQTEYAFVISPHGNGLDCHRTWEALILGCIPIVKTSPIDSVFDDLPVLIVNDWSDVTYNKLEETLHRFSNKHFNYERLYLNYWVNIIRNESLNI